MPKPLQSSRLLLVLASSVLWGCGDGGPTGPDLSGLELVLVQGGGQAAEPGSSLTTPFQVRLQEVATGKGRPDVRIRWLVDEGAGARLEPAESRTDSTGLAASRLTLGSALGAYRVLARVPGAKGPPPLEITAEAILLPELTLLPTGSVRAGDTILVQGKNLSATPSQNVVTFSGIRARVLSSTGSELRVEVPTCLPDREVLVQIRIGSLTTASSALSIAGGTVPLLLARGEDRIFSSEGGETCVHLPGEGGARYLAVPHSTGLVGGAVYPSRVVGLTGDGLSPAVPSPAPSPFSAPARAGPEGWPSAGSTLEVFGAQADWDLHLRQLERELVAEGGAAPAVAPRGASGSPARVPSVGEIRKFKVFNRKNEFDNVTAILQRVGEHVLVYVDQKAPAGGFDATDLGFFSDEFDDFIHPAVTETFGTESDLDGNDRVVILFTPTVNQLTDAPQEGYVGGFFFGLDLMEGQPGSNGGEVFYAVVPDPRGELGPPLPRATVLGAVPAVLAHEFEHMVHHNQRFLLGGATLSEALWLSEAMAQMAEDRVADALYARGRLERAMRYREGNWLRAHRFLRNPNLVSVLASLPPGTLAERGAGWLLLKQLSGQPGRENLLWRLARSKAVGVSNLTGLVGKGWGELLPEWAGALYLDGLSVPVRPELTVPAIELRQALSRFDGTFPLVPPFVGGSSFVASDSLWSSAADYFIITPPSAGGIALSVSGPGGLPPDPSMALQLLVVRIQ